MYAYHGLQLMYCTTAYYHTSLAAYAMLMRYMVVHRSYSYYMIPCILCAGDTVSIHTIATMCIQ